MDLKNLDMPFPRAATTVLFFFLPTLFYAGLITGFTFDFFTYDHLWKAYNALALSMLDGRLDVPYEAIGRESFYYDGKTYFYYGYFPVLLRLLLMPVVDLNTVPLAKLSVWLMTSAGASALQYALLAYTRPRDSGSQWTCEDRAKLVLLSLVIWFGSGYFIIAQTGAIYHETYAASLMLSSLLLAWIVGDIGRGAAPPRSHLAGYALLAALSLHTRPTVAVALYAAVSVMILWGALRSAPRREPKAIVLEVVRLGYPAVAVLLIGGFLLLLLNWLRFDGWFSLTRGEYGYFRYGEIISPRTCAHLFTNESTFELGRVIPNLFYYLFGHEYFHRRLLQLFGMGYVRAEYRNLQLVWLFSSALIISAYYVAALLRRSIAQRDLDTRMMLLLVMALAISPIMILSYRTLTIRYVSDLWPFFAICLLLFARHWLTVRPPKSNWLWYVLPLSVLVNVIYSTNVYHQYQKWSLYTSGAESPSAEVIERLKNPPSRMDRAQRLEACRKAGYGAWPLPGHGATEDKMGKAGSS